MSIYEQYDKLIYWNKTTNTSLLNNVLESLGSMETEFKRKQQKQAKQNQGNEKQSKASNIFFDVVLDLQRKYPGFNDLSTLVKNAETHCKIIQHQIDKDTNIQQLRNAIITKIETIVKDRIKNQKREANEFGFKPCFSVQPANFNLGHLQAFICMLNVFSDQFVFRLVTDRNMLGESFQSMETSDVVVSYYNSKPQHTKVGIALKTNQQKIFQYFLFRKGDLQCCKETQNQRQLKMKSDKSSEYHSLNKLFFVLYVISITDFTMDNSLEAELKNHEAKHWTLFNEKLPAIIGYLEMNNFYSAYAYMNQLF